MKYFVISDIHSFYDEMMAALNKVGYDSHNPNHTLIVCGDLFDRGPKAKETFNFIKNIPSERLILIKGNHEYLILSLLEKLCPEWYDHSNGTVSTIDQFVPPVTKDSWEDICKKFKQLDVYKFLTNTKIWKPYFELGDFIFVHSFIPLEGNPDSFAQYNPDWRNDNSPERLEHATWGCPWQLYKEGYFDYEIEKGKILVCGHWHVSDFHSHLGHKHKIKKCFDIYYGSNIIGLDACTALTKKVNVLVLEEQNNKIKIIK